jgi:hypothetical protein
MLTVFRRALAILVAVTLVAALPAAAQASAGKPAAAAAAKKKPKKAKKRRKKPKIAARLWYRIALDSTATVTGSNVNVPGSSTVTKSTWKGQSRAAVILFREPAPLAPGAGGRKILSQYRFTAAVAGTVVDAGRQITSQSPNQCPAHLQSLVQITPGSVDAKVSGRLLEAGGGTVGLLTRTLPGDAIETITAGMCLQDPPPRHTPAPGAVMCPPESGWVVTGKVAWRRAFTITATCFDSQVNAVTGGSTTVVASLTLAFTPCPGGGVKVARC